MRSSYFIMLLTLAFHPPLALAKAWQGVSPGVSTQTDVINRFGTPSTQGKLEGRNAMVYKGDQAISGTKQAQFIATENGVITEINVFPANQLDREAVEGTYGKSAQKTFTEDFRSVWIYRSLGVMVFFGKDGFVEAIRFKAGESDGTPRSGTTAPSSPAKSGTTVRFAPAVEGQPQDQAPRAP